MAVLRSQRQISKTEFENTFSMLFRQTREYTLSVPRRRHRWLCAEINRHMNAAYRAVIETNEYFCPDKTQQNEHKKRMAVEAIEHLYALEKPLMVMWNIQRFETDKMARWAEHINKEISLLCSVGDCEKRGGIMILDWQVINSANFLKNMSDLHRYTHSKVAGAKIAYDGTEGTLLISAVDDAWYCLIKANQKVPTTRKEYEKRRENISQAIMHLREMQRYLLSYFNLMHYSERVINEWCLLLTSELKLLSAIQKSDKKRFGSLS